VSKRFARLVRYALTIHTVAETEKLRRLRMAEETILEKAGVVVGVGLGIASNAVDAVKGAFTLVGEALKKSPAKKAAKKVVTKKAAKKAPTKKAAAKKATKAPTKKAVAKKAPAKTAAKKAPAKKSAAKKAPAKKAAKKAVKKASAKKAAKKPVKAPGKQRITIRR
jgi:outer membrane biosynthesis protein TonB